MNWTELRLKPNWNKKKYEPIKRKIVNKTNTICKSNDKSMKIIYKNRRRIDIQTGRCKSTKSLLLYKQDTKISVNKIATRQTNLACQPNNNKKKDC